VLLHQILGLDEGESIFLAEESLEDLVYMPVTEEVLSSGIDTAGCIELISEDGRLGLAIHLREPAEFWLLLSDRYSGRDLLREIKADREVLITEGAFLEALVEYYAISLADELFCQSCSVSGPPLYIEDRIDRLESFLAEEMPRGKSLLEVCCGGGMATQALKRLGFDPWSTDIDRCDLCQALKDGKLSPRRAMVLDGRMLHHFFSPGSFDLVAGFMMGLIDPSNLPTWQEIIIKTSSLAREMVLYTVYTEKEAGIIAEVLSGQGFDCKIIDNRDPRGIYDQWACMGRKNG
jgi:hypothetical protein